MSGRVSESGRAFTPRSPLRWNEKFLELSAATTTTAGSMSAADKALVNQLTTATAWAAPSFATNWGHLAGVTPVGYMKDANGRVWLKGVADKSTAVGLPDTIFTLPAGFRPTTLKIFPANTNSAFGEVRISTGGVVTLNVGADPVVLEGLSFDPTT